MKSDASEYQSPRDLAYAESLIKHATREAEAFFNLKYTAERKDGVIPQKYRELISIAVALTTQCAYCIDSHVKNAVEAGATHEEIAETVFIAAALRAGGAVGNGLLAMRLFDEMSEKSPRPSETGACRGVRRRQPAMPGVRSFCPPSERPCRQGWRSSTATWPFGRPSMTTGIASPARWSRRKA
jgi:AhpD family alkylhydroperoxidase